MSQGFRLDPGPTIAVLKQLESRLRDQVIAKALNAGADVIVPVAQNGAARVTGALGESIGKKIVVYRDSGTGVAVIGPRTDFTADGRVPWRYHHLVELGKINRDGSFTPGNPFLKRATEETRERALDAVAAVLNTEVSKLGGGA